MKRYLIADRIGAGTGDDPYRPDVAGAFVVVGTLGGRCVVKTAVASGTPKTTATLADCDAAGRVVATSLTLAQRATIKTWLANRGIDVSDYDGDGIADRRKLLGFIARRLLGMPLDRAEQGYDVE